MRIDIVNFVKNTIKNINHKGNFVVLFLLSLLVACEAPTPQFVINGETMGTYYRVSVVTDTSFDRAKTKALIDEELLAINQSMSTYIEDSEISLFNKSESLEWQPVSDAFYHVVLEAIATSVETNGAFDMTVNPLVQRWGFGADKRKDNVPSLEEIAQIMTYVGFYNIEPSQTESKLRKSHKQTTIDLSAIAKGYAVDRIAHKLTQLGYSRHLVDIGGEMSALGTNAKGFPWTIGIEKPVSYEQVAMQKIALKDVAMATSGDYRNFFEKDGHKYSHTINPKDGQSTYHKLASVTVIEPLSMRADALATALMVMGEDLAFKYALDNNLAVFLILREPGGFSTQISPEMRQYLLE